MANERNGQEWHRTAARNVFGHLKKRILVLKIVPIGSFISTISLCSLYIAENLDFNIRWVY